MYWHVVLNEKVNNHLVYLVNDVASGKGFPSRQCYYYQKCGKVIRGGYLTVNCFSPYSNSYVPKLNVMNAFSRWYKVWSVIIFGIICPSSVNIILLDVLLNIYQDKSHYAILNIIIDRSHRPLQRKQSELSISTHHQPTQTYKLFNAQRCHTIGCTRASVQEIWKAFSVCQFLYHG